VKAKKGGEGGRKKGGRRERGRKEEWREGRRKGRRKKGRQKKKEKRKGRRGTMGRRKGLNITFKGVPPPILSDHTSFHEVPPPKVSTILY
jgi:hypothetical protein